MSPGSWEGWIAWAGVVIPLAALAWSAVNHVIVEKRKAQVDRFEDFLSLLTIINNVKGEVGLYEQLAAAFQLRNFPEYRDILIRVYERHARTTTGFEKVAEEMNATISFLKK
jgi:hypothetical protein